MKHTSRKLPVLRETLRVLRALEALDLARARGGDAPPDSTNTQSGVNCPFKVRDLTAS